MPTCSDSADPGPKKILFGKYELGRLLGRGAFAKVYHARTLGSNQSVAIKVFPKSRISKSTSSPSSLHVTREISILRRLCHPHIVRLLEVLASRSKIYFVLEFVKNGELFEKVAKNGRLGEDLSRKYFQQLISAVGYCHSRGVFHRDLKPENILLDENGDIKVSDFGLSAVSDQIRSDGRFHTLCGTPAYVAPEILSKKGYDAAKVDVWSCGVILYVLTAGYLPFNDSNMMNMYKKIYRGEYRMPKWTSPDLRRLISRMLDTNPETRISVHEIFLDPWFRKGLDKEKLASMMRFHVEEEKEEMELEEERELNAFDIISFSSGVNLSGLFEPVSDRERFVTVEDAEGILGRVEELGKEEGCFVKRKGQNGNGGVVLRGQSGNLVLRVRVYRLTGRSALVEVEKGGDRWSRELWREKVGPALKLVGSTSDRHEPVS